MKRSIVAAAALVGASALTGAAVLPGSAAPGNGTMHTKRLVLHEIASQQVAEVQFVGSDKIRSARTHQVVGFHAFTGHYYPSKAQTVLQGALALKGGIMLGRVVVADGATEFTGSITKGSGKYAGVEGTISGHFGESATFVTVRYHD
jgi:hypothetical protein